MTSIKKREAGGTVAFADNAMETMEGALQYAESLLKSGALPAHFYEKGQYGPDLQKGKPHTVLLVLQKAKEIGMTPLQGLQEIVPINNLLTLKGDGAKARIMASGLVAEWKEEPVGSLQDGSYEYRITAKRKDNGMELTSSFSVSHAKRAGLWITDQAASKNPKLKYGPWYKYPDRMIYYRALGFLARTLFPDVLSGIIVHEEAMDYPDAQQQAATVQTERGDVQTETADKSDKVYAGVKNMVKSRKLKKDEKPSEPPQEDFEEVEYEDVEEVENVAQEQPEEAQEVINEQNKEVVDYYSDFKDDNWKEGDRRSDVSAAKLHKKMAKLFTNKTILKKAAKEMGIDADLEGISYEADINTIINLSLVYRDIKDQK